MTESHNKEGRKDEQWSTVLYPNVAFLSLFCYFLTYRVMRSRKRFFNNRVVISLSLLVLYVVVASTYNGFANGRTATQTKGKNKEWLWFMLFDFFIYLSVLQVLDTIRVFLNKASFKDSHYKILWFLRKITKIILVQYWYLKLLHTRKVTNNKPTNPLAQQDITDIHLCKIFH